MEKRNVVYRGIFPAIAVPFNDDFSINEVELRSYVRWLAGIEGITGLVANGHTGEINSLRRGERKEVTAIVADEVGDQIPVFSGVSAEGTLEAVELAQDAQEAGADGILLMPPHNWLRFGRKPQAPVDFFTDVAKSIGIDIIIHHYPAWTKATYPLDILLQLVKIPNVKAIKMGTREMARYESDVRALKKEHPEISILTCHDEYLLATMIYGIDGALVGFAGCIPELITSLWRSVEAMDLQAAKETADKIFPMAKAVYGMGEPSGDAHARLKEAIRLRGKFSSALMRPPVTPLSEEEKTMVAAALQSTGL